MKIQPITPFNVYNFGKTKKQENNIITQNNAYNPIAYNDLTFTARLCRTPEEFYAEPCNKNYMPETMKQYLNADYDDRKNMPPEQMLALVFDDINETKNLEQVKRIFPDEPLFKNLTDTPNKKSRVGVLAEIDLMREDGKTLFKNGKDNLGHYILKKIYLEGKTLEEINTDFKKDISVHYQGLSPINYQVTSAFGIKFPDRHFWNSFVPHRRRFEPIKPRKPIERRNTSAKTTAELTPKTVPTPKNRFENVKDWEIDSFSEALIKGNGSKKETVKRLKKSNSRDEASLGFVAKYMGEINSVVLEKLHVSPEMIDFFEDSENLSKSQKQKMDAYWQEPERRELRSLIMKDVIKLFFEAYGVDGQNDDFKQLIEYAHSIKPNRLEQLEKHNQIQAEYDAMFADEAEKAAEIEKVEKPTLEGVLSDIGKKYGVDQYIFKGVNGNIIIETNLKEDFQEQLKEELNFYPSAYANKFLKFVLNSPLLTIPFMLSSLAQKKGIVLPQDDERVMDSESIDDVMVKLCSEFDKENVLNGRAAQQVVIDLINSKTDSVNLQSIYTIKPTELLAVFNTNSNGSAIRNTLAKDKNLINNKYNEYMKPLSKSEVNKITVSVINMWKNYKPDSNVNADSYLSPLFYSISKYLNNPSYDPKEFFRKDLEKYIMQYGGTARVLIQKDQPKEIVQCKFEDILNNYFKEQPQVVSAYAILDEKGFEYIKIHNNELYKVLLEVKINILRSK